MANNRSIRIKDIAKLAGVSAGTVDRVLHNRGRVSKEAMDKINAVMDQIDYKPNLIARTLGSNKKYRLAILIPDPQGDPYWNMSHAGIVDAMNDWSPYGLTLEMFPFDHLDKSSFGRVAAQLLETLPDGIVVAPVLHEEAVETLQRIHNQGIPCIAFNTEIPEVDVLGFIGQDYFQSGRVAASLLHLHHPGPGTFAVVHLDEDYQNSIHLMKKEAGFRAFFAEKEARNREIIDFIYNPKNQDFQQEFTGLLNLPDLRGIFVSTSQGTAVAATELEKAGKKNISLVGYDLLEKNIGLLQRGAIDFLIHQNPRRQAASSINALVNFLMFNRQVQSVELFPLEIISAENLPSYLHANSALPVE